MYKLVLLVLKISQACHYYQNPIPVTPILWHNLKLTH